MGTIRLKNLFNSMFAGFSHMDGHEHPYYEGMPNSKRSKLEEEDQVGRPRRTRMQATLCFAGQEAMETSSDHGELCDLLEDRDEHMFATARVVADQPNFMCELSPLGLMLRKSTSLVDLIQKQLAQNEETVSQCIDEDLNLESGSLAPDKDKLKAANFPASMLQIGTWERNSRYDGDLVAKCYYAKRKLVWELLDSGLKSKMEFQWADISALKSVFLEGQPAILDIELSRPPLFFREISPQPRKHTLWHSTTDFTDGQATMYRHHSVQFPAGVLNRHFEKLLKCDSRLKVLSEQGNSVTNSCFFENKSMHINSRQQKLHYESALSEHTAFLPSAPKSFTNEVVHHATDVCTEGNSIESQLVVEGRQHHPSYTAPVYSAVEGLKHEPLHHAVSVSSDSAPKSVVSQLQRGSGMQFSVVASPSSVIDVRGLDESSSSSETEEAQPEEDGSYRIFDEHMHFHISPENSRHFTALMAGPKDWAFSIPRDIAAAYDVDNTDFSLTIQAYEQQQALNRLSLDLLGEPISSMGQHTYVLGQENLVNQLKQTTSSCSAVNDLVHKLDQSMENPHHEFLIAEESKLRSKMRGSYYRNERHTLEGRTPLTTHGSCVDLVYLPRIASLPQFLEPAP